MELLAGTQAHLVHEGVRYDRFREVDEPHAGYPRDEQLAALHQFQGFHDEADRFVEAEPEAGHLFVRDRQGLARPPHLPEERDDRPPAPKDVSIAHHREPGCLMGRLEVRRDEQLVRDELGGTVEVDRSARLVGGECHDSVHARFGRGVHHVLRPQDVGADELRGVGLPGVHLLQGGGVNDVVDAAHRGEESLPVAYVADDPPQPGVVGEVAAGLVLLEFVPRVGHDACWTVVVQDVPDERPAEGAGGPGEHQGGTLERLQNTQLLSCSW